MYAWISAEIEFKRWTERERRNERCPEEGGGD